MVWFVGFSIYGKANEPTKPLSFTHKYNSFPRNEPFIHFSIVLCPVAEDRSTNIETSSMPITNFPFQDSQPATGTAVSDRNHAANVASCPSLPSGPSIRATIAEPRLPSRIPGFNPWQDAAVAFAVYGCQAFRCREAGNQNSHGRQKEEESSKPPGDNQRSAISASWPFTLGASFSSFTLCCPLFPRQSPNHPKTPTWRLHAPALRLLRFPSNRLCRSSFVRKCVSGPAGGLNGAILPPVATGTTKHLSILP